MHYSYAMTASKVTPLADEKGVEEAGGIVVSVRGHFGRSWALLCLIVVVSMAHITIK